MAEGSQRRRRVDKQHRTPGHQVEIAIVAGPQGADFRPTSLTIPAGTVCLWRNQSGQTQDVLPVDDGPPLKGGPLPAGSTRLVFARRPATFAHRLASNPSAHLALTVIDGTSAP